MVNVDIKYVWTNDLHLEVDGMYDLTFIVYIEVCPN
jgi:hypothetical protein